DAGGGRGLAAAAVLRALPGAGEGPRSDARGPGTSDADPIDALRWICEPTLRVHLQHAR
ncbi:unnamed protein product, partial [Effrenium voratum]